jgi:hypothetical protein
MDNSALSPSQNRQRPLRRLDREGKKAEEKFSRVFPV